MGVKLDDETRERLKVMGGLKRRSVHWIMKEAIREYLDKEEEIEKRNREADEAWKEYRQTGKGVSHEEITAWLDSWGTDKETPCPDLKPQN